MTDNQAGISPDEIEMETPEGSDNEDDQTTAGQPNEVTAPPPPISELDPVPGYETIDYSDTFAPPPPSYAETMGLAIQNEGERQVLPADFHLSADDMREALLNHVAANCCWGSRAARKMQLTDTDMQAATHYVLETFTETRATSQAHQPYRGDSVDGPSNGPAPAPWDISISRPNSFNDSTMWMPVPHTESVRACYNCSGSGRVTCGRCSGRGRVRCSTCHGSGRRRVRRNKRWVTRTCTWCHGSGRRRCIRCHGSGRVNCPVCQACCQLKHFIKLSVTWATHRKDYIIERTDLPDELIKAVTGQEVFREEKPRITPINQFPNSQLVAASERLVEEHSNLVGNSLILMQKHYIRLVPVYEVKFDWKSEPRKYFVYGFERKVHAPEYPHQCCWGCSIL